MDPKIFLTIFASIFLAEIADKTQLATFLFATDTRYGKWLVFTASATALVVATGIAVFAGGLLGQWLNEKLASRVAGVIFILVGIWTILRN